MRPPWCSRRSRTDSQMRPAECKASPDDCVQSLVNYSASGQSCHESFPLKLCSNCSKQIEFGVMAPSEMVQASEVQIYERTLYKVKRALR